MAEGSNDAAIPRGVITQFAEAHPALTTGWLRPMNHVFNAETETAMLDALIDATITFLKPALAGTADDTRPQA